MKKILCQILFLLMLCSCCVSFIACNSSSSTVNSSSASQNDIVEPISVSLSANNLNLSVGEAYQLYATVVPSKANQSVVYSSVNKNCATVSAQGQITAIGKGNTVIRAETVNGLIATCNVEVTVAVGGVSGCMMYTKSSSSSATSYADAGALVQLIPTNIKSFPSDYYPSVSYNYEEYGIYSVTTDSFGNYNFDNIPIGEYEIILISKKARWHSAQSHKFLNDFDACIDRIYGKEIGAYVKKSSKKISIHLLGSDSYGQHSTITVKKDAVTNKSCTYCDWYSILG